MGRACLVLFALIVPLGIAGCRSEKKTTASPLPSRLFREDSELKMSNMRVQAYAQDGLDWELKSPYGEVFTRRNLMRVKQMNVQLFEKNQKSTEISAEQGFMATGAKPKDLSDINPSPFSVNLDSGDMFVNGNVVMVSTDGTRLSTDWARYNKKTDLIVSSAPVRLERNDSITTGVGLEASADMSRVHIFNETLLLKDTSAPGKK